MNNRMRRKVLKEFCPAEGNAGWVDADLRTIGCGGYLNVRTNNLMQIIIHDVADITDVLVASGKT